MPVYFHFQLSTDKSDTVTTARASRSQALKINIGQLWREIKCCILNNRAFEEMCTSIRNAQREKSIYVNHFDRQTSWADDEALSKEARSVIGSLPISATVSLFVKMAGVRSSILPTYHVSMTSYVPKGYSMFQWAKNWICRSTYGFENLFWIFFSEKQNLERGTQQN